MPRKFVCEISTDELRRAYIDEHRTLEEMCVYMGIKSPITAAKVLNERGISTNANERKKAESMMSMSDNDFCEFLKNKYSSGLSMGDIAKEIGITPSGVRKYFVKYGIKRRPKEDYVKNKPQNNPNWRGGKRTKKSGYIEIYCPEHPNANKRKCVYEHQLVVEEYIGRYLRPGEVVHHIDGNKSNNDINNLMLLTNSDHIKLHGIIRRSNELMGR